MAGMPGAAVSGWYGQAERSTCRDRLEEGCGDKGRSWLQVGAPGPPGGGWCVKSVQGALESQAHPSEGSGAGGWERLGLGEGKAARPGRQADLRGAGCRVRRAGEAT